MCENLKPGVDLKLLCGCVIKWPLAELWQVPLIRCWCHNIVWLSSTVTDSLTLTLVSSSLSHYIQQRHSSSLLHDSVTFPHCNTIIVWILLSHYCHPPCHTIVSLSLTVLLMSIPSLLLNTSVTVPQWVVPENIRTPTMGGTEILSPHAFGNSKMFYPPSPPPPPHTHTHSEFQTPLPPSLSEF